MLALLVPGLKMGASDSAAGAPVSGATELMLHGAGR